MPRTLTTVAAIVTALVLPAFALAGGGTRAAPSPRLVSPSTRIIDVRPLQTSNRDLRYEPDATEAAAIPVKLDARALGVVVSIAGPGLRIHCVVTDGGLYEVLGHADWNRRLLELAPPVCVQLNALAAAAAPPSTPASYAQAQALLVLIHESVHLSSYLGHKDEALTECRAIQLVHTAALTLGIDDTTARALGREALRYDAQLPGLGDWRVGLHEIPNYHAPGCYDDGPLDIHPDSHDWPN